jgi:hypothetical protein
LSVCKHRQLRPALRAKEATCLGRQALPGPISANQKQISPRFAGFQNDLYEDQKAAESPDQPPNQRPDQGCSSGVIAQPPIRAEP